MRERLLILLILTIAMAFAKHWESRYDRQAFQSKLAHVHTLLNQSPTGMRTLSRIGAFGIYRKPINIIGAEVTELQKINHSDGGAISKNSKGEYDVYLNKHLGANEIAHVITHEAQHIIDEKERVELLSNYPSIYNAVSDVAFDLYQKRDIREINSKFHPELVYVLKTLYCTEIRAYALNRMLHSEGIDIVHPFTKNNLHDYVNYKYLGQFNGSMPPGEARKVSRNCLNQKSFKAFQMELIRELKEKKPSLIASANSTRHFDFTQLTAFDSDDMDFDDSDSEVPGFDQKNDPNMPEVDKEDESLNSQSHENAQVIKEAQKPDVSVSHQEIDFASESPR